MAFANLALRFILELGGIAAVAFSGYQLAGPSIARWAVAGGAALALIAVWALVVAPNTQNGLSQPQKDIIGTVILLAAAGALAFAGHGGLAIGMAVLVLVNAALLSVFGHEVRDQLAGMPR
ncbi:MAG TPA: DUF2568 domain-containing protein [Candidatus Limnocylindria bacterium]